MERVVKRIKLFEKLVLLVFFVFFLSFWRLQILKHAHYRELSLKNIVKKVEIFAPRGSIVDRFNRKLVENRFIFSLSLKREYLQRKDEVFEKLSKIVHVDHEYIQNEIQRKKGLPYFIPVLLKKRMNFEELSLIESRKTDLPEVSIIFEPVRRYPYEGSASHVLGYMGAISREDAFIYGELNPNTTIGKTGIEKSYDELLRGENGWIEYIVDSEGKILKRSGIKPFQSGNILKLTLDIDLQRFVEDQLKGEKGSVIVMDPRDGGILAMASSPTYDLSLFTPSISLENWSFLLENPDKPLLNRALQGLYSPGSIFKIILAIAGMSEGIIKPEETIFCPGYINIGSEVYRCWKGGGHGHVNLYRAVVESCNVYFYNLGRWLGPEKIKNYAKLFGLGEFTGIDIPGEMQGIVPEPQWKENFKNEPWYPGDTVILSIGQGYIILTPLQIANFISTVANNGTKMLPHLLEGFYDKNGKFNKIEWKIRETKISIEKKYFETIKKCMWGVVNDSGTGRATKIQGLDVCGKTGTAEVVSRERAKQIKPHAWFAGFAPLQDPEIVVVVVLENSGKGGEKAAPIARNIFLRYFGMPVPETKTTDIKTVE